MESTADDARGAVAVACDEQQVPIVGCLERRATGGVKALHRDAGLEPAMTLVRADVLARIARRPALARRCVGRKPRRLSRSRGTRMTSRSASPAHRPRPSTESTRRAGSTGVPKSSELSPMQPPTAMVAASRPTSRPSPRIERRAKAAREIARHVAELRGGLCDDPQNVTPIDERATSPRSSGKPIARARAAGAFDPSRMIAVGDLETWQCPAAETSGDLHRIAQLHVLAAEEVRLADATAVERCDDAGGDSST